MCTDEYSVEIDPFAEKHYGKKFTKKYKSNWDCTLVALKKQLSKPKVILSRFMGEVVAENGDSQICKIEFRIAGTKQSRKASGNRCIIAINNANKSVRLLLIYHKDYLPGSGKETISWKKMIKENFSEYIDLL